MGWEEERVQKREKRMASTAAMKLGSKSEVFQRQGQTWNCTTGLPSDITIEIGDSEFHLHKFPLLSRSGALERRIGESSGEEGVSCSVKLDDLPGGAKSFELVAKFCYGVKLELNAINAVSLRCAAEKLQMTEEYGDRNLIFHTENFLTELFGSWKDSLKVLEACEEVLPYAEELHITTRCINSLAVKACAESALFGWPMVASDSTRSQGDSDLWNGIGTDPKPKSAGVDWWYDDVSSLSLPLYKRFILAVEAKGMKPESIAGSLTYYAKRHLSGLSRNSSLLDGANRVTASSADSALSDNDQRVLLEEIVSLLPVKHGVTSTKFLLCLLRTAMILHASSSCREGLENKIGAQLDDAALEDILIPNLGYSAETLYEIDCIQRILDHFILVDQSAAASSPSIIDEGQLIGTDISSTPMALVAKLVDGYLAEVASDPNLKFPKFQAMAASVPDYARTIDDGLYRAIDIYLKAHPWLTDTEREQLCRLMNCQKLSLEACTHAAQNERLPLRMVVQVLFFEQLRLRTSIASWFFVSENLDNPAHHRGNIQVPKNNGSVQVDGTQEPREVGSDEMRSRVTELERECSRMRLEIDKLGKPRNAWSNFSKKLGTKLKPQPFCNGEETPVNCQKDSKDIVKSKPNILSV